MGLEGHILNQLSNLKYNESTTVYTPQGMLEDSMEVLKFNQVKYLVEVLGENSFKATKLPDDNYHKWAGIGQKNYIAAECNKSGEHWYDVDRAGMRISHFRSLMPQGYTTRVRDGALQVKRREGVLTYKDAVTNVVKTIPMGSTRVVSTLGKSTAVYRTSIPGGYSVTCLGEGNVQVTPHVSREWVEAQLLIGAPFISHSGVFVADIAGELGVDVTINKVNNTLYEVSL